MSPGLPASAWRLPGPAEEPDLRGGELPGRPALLQPPDRPAGQGSGNVNCEGILVPHCSGPGQDSSPPDLQAEVPVLLPALPARHAHQPRLPPEPTEDVAPDRGELGRGMTIPLPSKANTRIENDFLPSFLFFPGVRYPY